MVFKYAYILPLIEGIWYPITFIITYTLSVTRHDIPAVFPYISDTGAFSIEKCIFSFMLSIGSLLMFSIVYLRYRHVKITIENQKTMNLSPTVTTLNNASLYLAYPSSIGTILVACFQIYPFLYIHLLGAMLAFLLGWIILVLQTYISFKLYPALGWRWLNNIRAAICIVSGMSLVVAVISGGLALILFKGIDVTQWSPDSGGYKYRLMSTTNEWVLVFGVVLYLALYYEEFKSIIIYEPEIHIINA